MTDESMENASMIPSGAGTKRFHLGDVLSILTDRMLSPSGMEGIYRISEHLAGEPVWTHQLGRVADESRPYLLAQFPALANVTGDGVTPDNHLDWLRARVAEYGEWFDVAPIPDGAHESIDPLSELAEKVHPDRIVILHPKEE